MKHLIWIISGSVIVLGLGIAAFLFFSSWGKPLYEPGDLTRGLKTQTFSLGKPEPIVLGTSRPDGTQEFSLRVSDRVTLAGFWKGQGKVTVVVHGGPGFPSEKPWEGLESFTSNRKFVYWDQRGSGNSSRPIDRFPNNDFPKNLAELNSVLGLAEQIADIERLRAALGVEQIDLVGHSFGGFIAGLYAIEFPERVGRLILLAPAPMIVFPPSSGGLYEGIRKALPSSEIPAYEAWLKDFFDYGKLFQRSESELANLNAGFIPFYEKVLLAKGKTLPIPSSATKSVGGWMMQAIFFSMGMKHDWSPAFSKIRVRTLLVFGNEDLSGMEDFEQYRVIPGVEIQSVEGLDHFLTNDRLKLPEVLKSFLN